MITFSEFLTEAAGKALQSNTGNVKTKGHIKRYIFPYLSSDQKKAAIYDLGNYFNEKDVKESDQESHGELHDPKSETTHILASKYDRYKKGEPVKITGVYRNGSTIMVRTHNHGDMPMSKIGTPAEIAATNRTQKGFSVEAKLQKHADPSRKPAGSTKTAFDFSAGYIGDNDRSVRGKSVKEVIIPEKAKKDEDSPIPSIRGESKASKKDSVSMGTSELRYSPETKQWSVTNKNMADIFSQAIHPESKLPLLEHLNKFHRDGVIKKGFNIEAAPGTALHYLRTGNVNALHLHRYAEDGNGNVTMDHGTTYTVGDNNPFMNRLGMGHLSENDLLNFDGKLHIETSREGTDGSVATIKHRPPTSVFRHHADQILKDPNNHMNLTDEQHGEQFRNNLSSYLSDYAKSKSKVSLTAPAFRPRIPDETGSGEHGGRSFYGPGEI